MALKITPDASLVTKEAIENRITQLKEQLKNAPPGSVDDRQLQARIRALTARLQVGSPERTAARPDLLKSKKDLE